MSAPDLTSERSVAGRKIIITGAASGMGRATAHLFAQEGAHVAVTDINASGTDKVAADITDNGGDAKSWTLDISNGDNVRQVMKQAADHFGGIDMLVNNAGISEALPLDDDRFDASWDRNIAVMLSGTKNMTAAALPYLRQSSCPRIVNIASTEALGATAQYSAYSAAKAGITGLTRSWAVEFGREGITVNAICPGPINTGMTSVISDEHKAIYAKRRTALGRYGEPEEIAHMILSLCLPGASFVTGIVLPVDGGLMVRNA